MGLGGASAAAAAGTEQRGRGLGRGWELQGAASWRSLLARGELPKLQRKREKKNPPHPLQVLNACQAGQVCVDPTGVRFSLLKDLFPSILGTGSFLSGAWLDAGVWIQSPTPRHTSFGDQRHIWDCAVPFLQGAGGPQGLLLWEGRGQEPPRPPPLGWWLRWDGSSKQ